MTMPSQDRRAQNVAIIKEILEDRRQHFGDAMAMTREELATLNSINRMIALKHALLNNMAEAARKNPNSDIVPSLIAYISVHAEASEIGCCTYAAARIADFFGRDAANTANLAACRWPGSGRRRLPRQRRRGA